MKDDELDRLLSEVDDAGEFRSARKEGLRVKQEIARKADTVPVEDAAGSLSDEQFIARIRDLALPRDLLQFRKGLLDRLHEHVLCSQQLNKKCVDLDQDEITHTVMQKYRFDFQRHTGSISQAYDEYYPILSQDSLEKKARRDYDKFFDGFEEPNKVRFLTMKELFLRLREFNSRVRKEWSDVAKGADAFRNPSDGKAVYLEIHPIIETGVALCQKTDGLEGRIAAIIGLGERDMDVLEKDIEHRISYHASFPYTYEAIFDLDAELRNEHGHRSTEDVLDPDFVDKSGAAQQAALQEDTHAGMHGREPAPAPTAPERPEIRMAEVPFTVRGKSSWNTREPYVLKIEYEKLQKDYQELETVFYYISQPDTSENIDAAIKRSLVRYLSDPSKTALEEYEDFLKKSIASNLDMSCSFFAVREELRTIFAYHLGPVTIHRQLALVFQYEKYGQCCRYLPGNRVVRFLPVEYMKETVLNWCEANINSRNLEFDKIQLFSELRSLVARKYSAEVDKYSRLLDETIARQKLDANPQFNRNDYFKSRFAHWFGVSRIQVYNRFIDKTIFK